MYHVGLACNPDPPAEPIEREYNDAALLFTSDEQVLERLERLERSNMKPILFSTRMVQAILAGRKTQTRRICKPQPNGEIKKQDYYEAYGIKTARIFTDTQGICANYALGDILWVRETWCEMYGAYFYKADVDKAIAELMESQSVKWRPSIHMPREAARLFLSVTDVRVERLQDITHEDVLAEGIPECAGRTDEEDCNCADGQFIEIWESIYAKRGYGWDSNPFVWVYTFERETEKGAV